MAYPLTPIKTKVTQISSNEYLIGKNEKCPAVHYIDDKNSDIQILIYCSEMTIKWGNEVYFTMTVLKWIPEFQYWTILTYTPPFNIGRMIVDNQTYVDPQTGLPVIPQPTDDLEKYIGEYNFWEETMGVYIIPAIQEGATRRFNNFT